ncbi:hypothetical protein GV791_10090 [Nocardia cyriacigeorgica]|uniref:Carbohydrate kinase PfkB domain-containing protein n=1 Tax=Nocardia cyriacigeorgica TaxID=135487 RepID=A0A6P1CK55_9NOCA|nr:PfkB family carbohydrate kinase [Nocardia cyriacigeorgica]NEW32910.1 hypothetical protein [Nocardia cyriacigeorgica]BDT87511.1 hypothetical protein FMUAM8_32750 [Nocardia cyriacigeorgica]
MTSAGPLVIVGDVLLDIDIDGRADRRSPDGPVPVVDVTTIAHRPGGAGLAATLAAHDTGEVVLVAGFADDESGHRLRALLSHRVELVELPFSGSTVCKERVRAVGPCAGGESGFAPITRLDFGHGRIVAGPLSAEVRSVLANARAVLVADYGRGAAAHPQIRTLLEQRSRRTPLVWDPHPKGPPPVPGADLVTPNRPEAEQLVPDSSGFGARARELARRWSARAVTITLGADGAVLSYADRPAERIPVPVGESGSEQARDTCGAGDRFAVAATIAMSAGASAEDAVRHAVAAASAFVADGAATAFAEPASQIPAPEQAGSDPNR